jgi:DNA-binding transcriptional LysR family regulator
MGPMIDRYLMRYFLAVIDAGNFSKAAAACNVSQPTLSAGIAKLEGLLERPLFNRTNRRVELTPAGAQLLDHARRIEASFAAAERDVRSAQALGTIRLGLLVTTPARWAERLTAIRAGTATDQRLQYVEGRERDLAEHLALGRIDAALTLLRPDRRFDADPLLSEGYRMALGPAHPLAGEAMLSAEQLRNEPMIVRQQCELLSETSRYFTARGVRPFFAARTASEGRALGYVRAGVGVTVIPESLAEPGIAAVALEDFNHVREIGLVYSPHADRDFVRESLRVGEWAEALND